jgi:predicted acetyltransferase
MTGTDAFLTAPADPIAEASLASAGFRYDLVDPADAPTFARWLDAVDRGFLGPQRTAERHEVGRLKMGAIRRNIGVYDDTLVSDADVPVATVHSWPAELTVPGSSIDSPLVVVSWAISSVTVAPTHRRRGIARNLLEGELRTAASLGIPIAMLTVSESTIYGRFGFSPAAFATDWKIDTRRATWTGPAPSGRVEFISTARYREELPVLHDRVRHQNVGDIDVWPLRWDQLVGITDPEEARTKELRAVRHLDADGVTRGLALYRLGGGEPDFALHTLELQRLDAETPDAAAALWRYLLEHDLVTEVSAELRPTDEVVRWQIADWRSAKVSSWEHQYLRILDVAAAFEARRYEVPGELVIEVDDPLGFAGGTWQISVAGSSATGYEATVTTVDVATAGVPALRLTVNELSSLYLGGVAATTLLDAGRLTERSPGDAAAADRLLRSVRAPWLSVWY